MSFSEKIERQRVHGALGEAPGAVRLEPSLPPMVEQHFGDDAPCRVARAEKEDAVNSSDHRSGRSARSCSGRLHALRGIAASRLAARTFGCVAKSPQRALAIYRGLAIGEEGLPRDA